MKVGFGQDSHAFLKDKSKKPCVVGGLVFEDAPGLDADSDGDVVFHAICNAITSITHVPIMGRIAIKLCHDEGITDSAVYLEEALDSLEGHHIEHVALSIEGKKPHFQKRSEALRENIAEHLSLDIDQVGITFTSGDGMTAFGRGEGLQCFCVLTVSVDIE